MSRKEIMIPEVGQTTSEVRLVQWRKNVGDTVKRGDVLADLETDKMVVELESYTAGTLVERFAEADQMVAVGTVVAVLETAGVAVSASAPSPAPPALAPVPAPAPAGAAQQSMASSPTSPASPAASPPGNGHGHSPQKTVHRPKATPAAKALAGELGVSLAAVAGTGPEGIIIRRNVREAAGRAATPSTSASAAASADTAENPAPLGELLDRHRLATGRAMAQSKREIPHFYLEIEVAVDALETDRTWRNQNAPSGAGITVTDYLIAACARALAAYPRFNATFANDRITPHRDIHLGLAVSAPQGLLLPALHHADRLGLEAIAQARRELVERARQGKVDPPPATFTISNLGMYGVTRFGAIVPPGQSAILAVGAIQRRVVMERDTLRNARFMTLTLSIDHRVADGAEGAEFLAKVRELLEAQSGSF